VDKSVKANTINILALFFTTCVSFFVAIWFTPYLVKTLGPAAYGLIPLALSMISYFSVISQTLGAAINRRLVAVVNSKDAFKKELTVAVVICVGTVVILAPILIFMSFGFVYIIDIPEGYEFGALCIFLATAFNLLLSLLALPLQTVIFSANQLYHIQISTALKSVARVIVIVALFTLILPSLISVSVGLAVGGVLGVIYLFLAVRKNLPRIKFAKDIFDLKPIFETLRTGSGVLLAQIGTILVGSTDIVILNLVVGADASGRYAAIMQWSMVIKIIGFGIATIFSAQIMHTYHHSKSHERVLQLKKFMTFCALVLALAAGFLISTAEPLLTIWIDETYGELSLVLIVGIIPLALNLVCLPLNSVLLAADHVFWNGIVTVFLGVVNIIICYCILKFTDWGLVGISATVTGILAFKSVFFLIPYSAWLLKKPIRTLFPPIFRMLLWIIIVIIVAQFWLNNMTVNSFVGLFLIGLLTAMIFIPLAFATLAKQDRDDIIKWGSENLRTIL